MNYLLACLWGVVAAFISILDTAVLAVVVLVPTSLWGVVAKIKFILI